MKNISNREMEVLTMISYGESTKEIAHKLFISLDTVKSHRKNLLQKFGASNSAGMVRCAFEYGLLVGRKPG